MGGFAFRDWAPSFYRESPLFWPIARAARRLEHFVDWPTPDDLTALFARTDDAKVSFQPAAPKPRRGPPPDGPRYDARIAVERVVPTRARSWHDLLNALVWVTFPRAKLALHARQHWMIAARLGEDMRPPSARSPEQDAVAMLDEGGVVVLRARSGPEGAAAEAGVVFGHAIYEGLVCGGPPMVRAAAYVVEVRAIAEAPEERVRAADEALAVLLSREAPIGRADFGSLVVNGTSGSV